MNPRDMWLGEIVKCLRDRFGLTVGHDVVDAFVVMESVREGVSAIGVARRYFWNTPTPNNALALDLCDELRKVNREASLTIANFETVLRGAISLMSPEQIEEFGELDGMRSLRAASKSLNRLFEPDKVEFPIAFYVPRNVDSDTAEELNDALAEAMRAAALDVLKRDTRFKGVKYAEK